VTTLLLIIIAVLILIHIMVSSSWYNPTEERILEKLGKLDDIEEELKNLNSTLEEINQKTESADDDESGFTEYP